MTCAATPIQGLITKNRVSLPLAASLVRAGFPSPADDYLEAPLDLNDKLVRNPPATFLVRVDGESMRDAGIFPGDMLVVDKSLEAGDGNIVIAVVNGEFTVKRLFRRNGRVELRADNPRFPPIRIADGDELDIWGVVKHVIRDV